MNLEFLEPVSQKVLTYKQGLHPSCLGHKLMIHSEEEKLPDLSEVKIAVLGVRENRRQKDAASDQFDFDTVRSAFYALFPGNWSEKIADLGDILPGNDIEDTEFAFHETITELLNNDVIPFILGGSQDLTYAQYRAYDVHKEMVNLVNVDASFDIGNSEAEMTGDSYVGKMIIDEPFNLFNYANLGYQTYLNPPEDIDLIERLFFEAYRLGEVSADLTLAEPVMRDADLVSVDINAATSLVSGSFKNQPNGFEGREICTLARYAGISDKVSSFGLYNLQDLSLNQGEPLIAAEILWYFIEGVNYRKNEQYITDSAQYLIYNVPVDHENLIFYKSKRSGRWWIQIPMIINNKIRKETFLPCNYEDYLEACNQEIPERWFKAKWKNQL